MDWELLSTKIGIPESQWQYIQKNKQIKVNQMAVIEQIAKGISYQRRVILWQAILDKSPHFNVKKKIEFNFKEQEKDLQSEIGYEKLKDLTQKLKKSIALVCHKYSQIDLELGLFKNCYKLAYKIMLFTFNSKLPDSLNCQQEKLVFQIFRYLMHKNKYRCCFFLGNSGILKYIQTLSKETKIQLPQQYMIKIFQQFGPKLKSQKLQNVLTQILCIYGGDSICNFIRNLLQKIQDRHKIAQQLQRLFKSTSCQFQEMANLQGTINLNKIQEFCMKLNK